MGMSQANHFLKNNNKKNNDVSASMPHQGFTLIEVLIALAIVSIAMTAIIKAATQNIRGTNYLQDKTIALWVGQQVLNEARVGLLTLPENSNKQNEKTMMLGQDWYWQAVQEETPNSHIQKITVTVFKREDDTVPLINLESYLSHEE